MRPYNHKAPLFFWTYLILVLGLSKNAMGLTALESKLQEFNNDPIAFMQKLPTKYNKKGQLQKKTPQFFTLQDIKAREFITQKNNLRDQLILSSEPTDKSEIEDNDRVGNLIDNPSPVTSLRQMEEKKLLSASLTNRPWSDDYWPYYRGVLGARYADPGYTYLFTWKESKDYVTQAPSISIFDSQNQKDIDMLSPSEKYDLLLDTNQSSLTDFLWKQGQMYYEEYGKVERWMGICHGWAPASYLEKRPLKRVQVLAADGKTQLTFYPADIRALISLLWAQTRTPSKFMGGRCYSKEVKYDENGRILEQSCFDNNPGSWHKAIVNQIGVANKSFVMDATFDYEVWNQPVISYSYSYFNPQLLKQVDSLNDATVSVNDFTNDKFKKYRSGKTTSVVGISMEVTYSLENRPSQTDVARPDVDDEWTTVTYIYDLELDSKGTIIGGEWYEHAHPDFLWTPTAQARPLSVGDYYLLGEPIWNGQGTLNEQWKHYGSVSAQRGQPLWKVVQGLIELSRK